MSKKHDESRDLRLVSRICKPNLSNKTLKIQKGTTIGIRVWGRLDFLTHYCKWTIVWE